MEKARAVAEEAVIAASAAARAVANTLSVDMEEGTLTKKDTSPVTVADFAVQALICKALLENFPDEPVMGEESSEDLGKPECKHLLDKVVEAVQAVVPGATASDVCKWIDHGSLREYRPIFWTLDPIDGTKGFLRREQYALCVARIVDGKPDVGALSCPNLPLDFDRPSDGSGVVISGCKGQGAWCSPLDAGKDRQPQRMLLESKEATSLRFCESVESGHGDQSVSAKVAEELGITAPPLRLDSQAKYAALIRGNAEIYLRLPKKKKDGSMYVECIWDHAAGALLLEEAGGVVTDLSGKTLDFGQGPKLFKNAGIVGSCSRMLHDRIIASIANHM